MRGALWLLGLLALFGQENAAVNSAPEAPEILRVLAIEARQIDGAPRHLDPSLEEVRTLLERIPGNHFTEKSFFELETPYGQEVGADLGGGYRLVFRPTELTDAGEVVFECHIDLTEGGRTVEALRVTGRAIRGQGAIFRGLTLPAGELVVVMSIAKEKDSPRGGRGAGGQLEEGGEGGGAGTPGAVGGGDGASSNPEEEVAGQTPELQSREDQDEPESTDDQSQRGQVVSVGAGDSEPDRATIEGILRALEEQDIAEQKNQRGRRFDVLMKGDWW